MGAPTAFGPLPPGSQPSDKEICLYVAEMCTELRRMARRPRFRTISYLLDMVRLEAEKIASDLPK
jgi:hypothetical protein